MNLSGEELLLRKKLYWVMAIAFAVAYTLTCFAVSPLLVYTGTDIAFDGTVIPSLLDYMGRLLEVVAVSVSYAVIICGIFKFTFARVKGIVIIFAVATVYKYAANMVVDWIMSGSIPSGWIWDIVNVVFYSALEMIQLAIVIAIVKHISASNTSGKLAKYPFDKVYDKKNLYQRSAFFCALVVFLSKAFGRLVNDSFSIIVSGLPEKAATWGLMALSYVFDAVVGLLCYIVIIFVLSRLMDKIAEKTLVG